VKELIAGPRTMDIVALPLTFPWRQSASETDVREYVVVMTGATCRSAIGPERFD
jgi:hypothetical protein